MKVAKSAKGTWRGRASGPTKGRSAFTSKLVQREVGLVEMGFGF